jgi:FkbM family methyltransferase
MFFEYFKKIVNEKITNRITFNKILNEIVEATEIGSIAFYPCSKFSREIVKFIKSEKPELINKIFGYFDLSDDAVSDENIPVYNLNKFDIYKDKISTIVISSNYYSQENMDVIKKCDFNGKILSYSQFETSIGDNEKTKDIMGMIEKVYSLLADEKSKATYMTAWLTRLMQDKTIATIFQTEKNIDLTGDDYKYKNYLIKGLKHPIMKQKIAFEVYHSELIKSKKNEVVFDLGGFKGDTAIFFADKVGEKGKVYTFEPIHSNFEMIKMNAKSNNLEDIIVPINKAVSNKDGFMNVISGKQTTHWSYLTNNDEGISVAVTTLDNFVSQNSIKKLDFIKMDVEGAECDVLKGASKLLKNKAPKLAIALYHKTSDLFTIPVLIHEINPKYKIYIRSKISQPFGLTLFAEI